MGVMSLACSLVFFHRQAVRISQSERFCKQQLAAQKYRKVSKKTPFESEQLCTRPYLRPTQSTIASGDGEHSFLRGIRSRRSNVCSEVSQGCLCISLQSTQLFRAHNCCKPPRGGLKNKQADCSEILLASMKSEQRAMLAFFLRDWQHKITSRHARAMRSLHQVTAPHILSPLIRSASGKRRLPGRPVLKVPAEIVLNHRLLRSGRKSGC